jgi:hypothetical protein
MACKYTIKSEGKEYTFDDKESLIKFVRSSQILEDSHKQGNPEMTTQTLANILRQQAFGENNYNPKQLKLFQSELLEKFIALENQAAYFYKIGSPLALTKGLGKGFEYMDAVNRNLQELGIGAEMPKDIPFDVRYLLTGDEKYKAANSDQYVHKITANNIKIMNDVGSLARTIFMERSPVFINTAEKTISNLKNNLNNDEASDLKNELSAFSQIAAYKQWIQANDKQTSTLRNSLIYDSPEGKLDNIVDIVRQAQELAPANTFLSYILPVSTQVKIGKKQQKNILNRDLINTIEGRTRGKIEPDLISSLMDSFTELYQNPRTQYHAKALFDYLIVKDGLMFKNKSFIKMLPTIMFKEMSEATDHATKLMGSKTLYEYGKLIKELAANPIVDREGNETPYFSKKEKDQYNDWFKTGALGKVREALYEKVFGMNSNELYNKFENIYATDVTNQFNISYIRPTIGKAKKLAKAINFEDKGKIMNINLFDEKHKALRGTEEGNKYLKDVIDELGEVGFSTDSEKALVKDKEINKLSIQFKKYILVQGTKGKKLFQLTSVFRDGKTFTGAEMTDTGDMIPKGVSAQYKEVIPVGTSNTTGVANLGTRPTREQLIKNVDIKTKEAPIVPNNTPVTTHTDATEKTPITPQPSQEDLPPSAGIFGGLQQLAYNEANDLPLDFFNNEQIDEQTDNC